MHSPLLDITGPYGLLIVFGVVLVGQIGVPIPAIVVLVGAGTLAASAEMSVVGSFAIAMLACVIADGCLFMLGRHLGMRALKMLDPLSLSSDSSRHFERWRPRSLIIAKFVPGLSTIAPPLAGALDVSWLRFVLLSAIGSALWVAAGLGAGIIFAEQVPVFTQTPETHWAIVGACGRLARSRLRRVPLFHAPRSAGTVKGFSLRSSSTCSVLGRRPSGRSRSNRSG